MRCQRTCLTNRRKHDAGGWSQRRDRDQAAAHFGRGSESRLLFGPRAGVDPVLHHHDQPIQMHCSRPALLTKTRRATCRRPSQDHVTSNLADL